MAEIKVFGLFLGKKSSNFVDFPYWSSFLLCLTTGCIQDLENLENLENLEIGKGSLENLEKLPLSAWKPREPWKRGFGKDYLVIKMSPYKPSYGYALMGRDSYGEGRGSSVWCNNPSVILIPSIWIIWVWLHGKLRDVSVSVLICYGRNAVDETLKRG